MGPEGFQPSPRAHPVGPFPLVGGKPAEGGQGREVGSRLPFQQMDVDLIGSQGQWSWHYPPPPSMTMTLPFRYSGAPSARKRTTWATSWGSQNRFRGTLCKRASFAASDS